MPPVEKGRGQTFSLGCRTEKRKVLNTRRSRLFSARLIFSPSAREGGGNILVLTALSPMTNLSCLDEGASSQALVSSFSTAVNKCNHYQAEWSLIIILRRPHCTFGLNKLFIGQPSTSQEIGCPCLSATKFRPLVCFPFWEKKEKKRRNSGGNKHA